MSQSEDPFTVTFEARNASAFLKEWSTHGAEAAAKKYGVEAQAGTPTVRDPLGFGLKGAYPDTKGQNRVTPRLINRMYDDVGLFGAIVDQWASDTFGEAWTLESEKNPEWAKAVAAILERLDLAGALEDADRNVLMHGKAVLLYRIADETGAALSKPAPSNVPDDEVEVVNVPMDKVGKPVEDRDGALTGIPITLKGGPVTVHPSRIQVVRERPVLDDHLEGKAFLRRTISDVILCENMKWSAGESYYRRASPLIQAIIEPGAQLDEPRIQQIREKVQSLVEGTTQRAVVKDYRLEGVGNFSNVVNPQPYWDLGIDAASTSSRIPKHILVGGAAGALASAAEDTKRYLSRVSRREERYGTRTVKAAVEILVRLGALPEPPEDWTVKWRPLDEPTFLEKMQAWKARGEALGTFAGQAPFPAELVDYKAGKLPDDPNAVAGAPVGMPAPPVPQPGAPAATGPAPTPSDVPPKPPAPSGHGAEGHACDGIPEDPDVKVLRLRHQADIQGAYNTWLTAYLAPFKGDPRVEQVDPDDPVIAKARQVAPDPAPMAKAIQDLLLDAGRLGGGATMRQFGPRSRARPGLMAPQDPTPEDFFDFLDDTPIRTFRVLAEATSAKAADAIAASIRSSLAQGLAAGEGLRDLRARVIHEFDVSPRQAEVIARTESMRGFNYGHREALRQLGAESYQVNAFGEACPICAPLDGQVFPLTDTDHVPPLHPNCRCVMTARPGEFT